MSVRERLTESLAQHEGLVLKVYDDATGRVIHPGTTVRGYATIGFGRNLVGRGITLAEAKYLKDNDLDIIERELDQAFAGWREWAEARQWAIMELGYNLGVLRFVSQWPNTTADIRAGNWDQVASRLLNSKWRRQVGDGRALAIIRAIQSGVFT